ncbi:MAG: superoxide dismutase [Planctomycetes bacterium]|nr:superoxide dismutase [Planctomycetota bacterium]
MNQDSQPALPRRDALSAIGVFGAASLASAAFAQVKHTTPAAPETLPQPQDAAAKTPASLVGFDAAKGEYVLPPLPYDKNALEPHIDAQTMEIHHDRHHKAYVDGLNKAVKTLRDIREGGDAALVKHWSREVSFHGSGHVNHTLFWNMLAPAGKGGGGAPGGKLAAAIDRDFGSFDKFLAHFKAAAAQVEGGGWAWLVKDSVSGRLLIIQEEKQQDMMLTGAKPVLGIDVWEHAYYLKYQNKRTDYITAIMNVVNWKFCESLFDAA